MTNIKHFLLTVLAALVSCLSANAYDFIGTNSLGDIFYVDIISEHNLTCSITHNNDEDNYDAYSGENLVVPSFIANKGVSYSVIKIGDNAFRNCKDLKMVTLPSTVTEIGENAFYDSGITNITIGNNIQKIGRSAFWGCDNLTKVNINDLAAWCNIDFEFGEANPLCTYSTYRNGEYRRKVTQLYINDEPIWNLEFPEGITEIKDYAFCGCSNIRTIILNHNIKTVGNEAFSDCTNLQSVNLNRVQHVGDYAFSGCSNLQSVNFGSVQYIGHRAFANTKLSSVSLPDGVTLDEYVFSGCNYLTFDFEDLSSWFTYNFTSSRANPMSYGIKLCVNDRELNSLSIPENVTEIKDYSFCNSRIVLLSIPESVTRIGDGAFQGCTRLASVEMTDAVEEIGRYAFAECTALKTIEISANVSELNEGLLYNCCSLENLILRGEIQRMWHQVVGAENAFMRLKNLTVYHSIKNTEYNSFCDCNVENIYIADVAKWCNTWVSDMDGSPIDYANLYYLNGDPVTDLVIPEGVTSIGNGFQGKKTIKSLVLPNSINRIGNNAFQGTGIENIKFPEKEDWEIGGCAFNAQPWLDKQPDVIYIGSKLYHIKPNVTELTIREGTTEVVSWATADRATEMVDGCGSGKIKSITIPSFVKKVGRKAFSGLPLEEVRIENDITYSTFYSDRIYIDSEAFCYDGWSGTLSSVYYNASELPEGSWYFHSLFGDGTLDYLFVPNRLVDDFRNSEFTSFCSHIEPMGRSCEVTMPAFGISTLWLDYDAVIPEGIEAYYADCVEETGDGLTAKLFRILPNEGEEQAVLPRNTGVVIRATKEGTYSFVETDAEGTPVESLLTGYAYGNDVNVNDDSFYALTEEDVFGLMAVDENSTVSLEANKAYLKLPQNEAEIVELVFSDMALPEVEVYDGNPDSYLALDAAEALATTTSANALFFMKKEKENLPNNFIVKGTAKSIALTDAQPFYCPTDVTAEQISYTRNFEVDAWQAIYLPFAMSYDDWKNKAEVAYINNVHQWDDDKDGNIDRTILEFITKTSGSIEPNKPYVIKPKQTGEVTFTTENTTLFATPATDGYVDCRSTTTEYTLYGTYQEKTDMCSGGYYAMWNGNFMSAESDAVTLAPFRTYLKIENRNGAGAVNKAKRISIMVDGVVENEVTGIMPVATSDNDAAVFNLAGQKVGNGYKGIIVKNGKKYINK